MDQEISIKDYVTNSYLVFGKSMNIDRHLPYYLDGLKPVYQRLIFSAFQFKDYMKCATVAGLCIGQYHPHSDKSLKKTIARIVNLGLFDGQGNFGYHHMTGEVDEPAAMRYTEIRLKPEIKNQISKFIEFVPKTLSESGYEMPTYIPTPIPFCLAEYTKVKLADGRSITMKELAIECEEGKENFLFSCSEDGEFRISKLKKCWKTKSVNKLIRITLDNDEVIDSTEDHKFMLRDGSYLPASELQVGISLMPGYFGESTFYQTRGRVTLQNNYTGEHKLVMDMADIYNKAHGVYDGLSSDKTVRHHIDKNPNNNNPTNILRVNHSEHISLHSEDISNGLRRYNREHKDEVLARAARAKERGSYECQSIKCKAWNRDPEIIRKQVESKRRNGDYERSGARLAEFNRDPEVIRRRVETRHRKDNYKKFANSDPSVILSQHRGKFRKRYYKLLESMSPEDAVNSVASRWNFSKYFSSVEEFKSYINFNHKIKSIEIIELDEAIDVYDLEVEDRYHNFLLDAGVVVHNCLISGDQGIAIGINQKIPAFTAKSILKAYLTDNPDELVSQYGLTINKEKSGLKRLWEEGQGRLFLSMKVTRDGNGATIEGDTTLFTPNLSYLFQEYKWGNVDYQNLSEGVGKLRFSKPARTRKMSVEYIQSLVEEAAKWDSPYYIRVHDETRGFPISMRTWIDVCYKNYSNLIIKGSEVEIGRLERKIKFYTNLNSVYNDLVNTKDSKNDIASKHNIDVGLVRDIASKSADYVRHTDVNEKIHECESKIDFIRSNSVKSQIESYVGVLK